MGNVVSDIKPARNRGGRPRGFDRDQAVTQATELFRCRGYEGVSIGDLTVAMGIAPPSLYAAFGSKAALFEEALDQYARAGDLIGAPGVRAANTAEAWTRALLDAALAAVAQAGAACLISTGMLLHHPDLDPVAALVARRRAVLLAALEAELRRWMPQGDAAAAARLLLAILQGMSAQARDGATPDALRSMADLAVAAVARADARQGAQPDAS